MPDEQFFRFLLILILVPTLVMMLIYRIRAARSGEKISRRAEGMVIFPLLRLSGLACWVSVFLYMINPQWMIWSSVPLPDWLRWMGAPLGGMAAGLLWWTARSLGHNLTDTVVTRAQATLVQQGPYRWVRHPLYSSAALLFLSASLLSANWFLPLMFVFALVLLVARTRIEEEKLVEKFGDAYRQYSERTGRFVPRWRS